MNPTTGDRPPTAIKLWAHTYSATGMDRRNSGYISTTASQNIAIRWVNDHFQENAYVYHIIATPNFIDVNGTLRDYSPFPQEIKFAALGVIHWNQIIGWHRIANGSVGSLVRNRDYQRTIYRNFFAGGE